MNKAYIYPPCDKWKFRNKGEKVYIENSSKKKVLTVGKGDIVNEESLIKNDTNVRIISLQQGIELQI